MSTNATRQANRELDVFAQFISITGLPIDPASVQICCPPAPDIECRHDIDGPLSFELTELIHHDFAATCGRQSTTQDVLYKVHQQLPAAHKNAFDQQFGTAYLYFHFQAGTTTNKVRGNIRDVFSELSSLRNDFEGQVDTFASNTVSKFVKSVKISRGEFVGPSFGVRISGGLGVPVVPAIRKKLANSYTSDHPIELLGYLDFAGMLPPQLWQGAANSYFADLSDLGPFPRIWVVNLRTASIEIVHPPT